MPRIDGDCTAMGMPRSPQMYSTTPIMRIGAWYSHALPLRSTKSSMTIVYGCHRDMNPSTWP